MISKAHRFHGYGSLRYVYQNGQTVRGPLTSLKFSLNPRRETYRLAVVVSRKINKSAIVRNRIRRRLYEAIRLREKEITAPYDMVMTVFSEQLNDLSGAELDRLVGAQLHQAKIIASKQPGKNTP